MIVLHGAVSESQFFLWGERPLEPQARTVKGRPRKGRPKDASAFPEVLPYDAGIEALTDTLKDAGFDFLTNESSSETMMVWLPTADNKPLPSSPLIAPSPGSDLEPILAPWKVTVLLLSIQQTVELLCSCVGKAILAPGVIIGKDLSFWTIAMRFAAELVAKHHFLPGLNEDNGDYIACWKPVFSGSDAERLARLVKAIPGVSRALKREGGSLPETPSLKIVSGFMERIVDHLIRSTTFQAEASSKSGLAREHKTKKKPAVFESLHDQWLHALLSIDGVMEGDRETLAALDTQIRGWQRPVTISTTTPFRLCFRLEEPNGHEDNIEPRGDEQPEWYVRYLLQSTHDPSLLVPAGDIWTAESQETTGKKGKRKSGAAKPDLKNVNQDLNLLYNGFNIREYALLSLGQASGICPHIETSLKTSAPAGYKIDTTHAYEFLTQKALVLEQSGFGVMLPAWWTRKGTKLRLTARANVKTPIMQGGSGLSLNEIVKFDWEVALGDEKISYQELNALAKLKIPLVKVRGQWVQLNTEQIREALDFWKKKGSGQATAREIVQMALGAGKSLGPIPFEGISATGWMAELLAKLQGKTPFQELPTPDEFQGTLRPYQIRGYSWIDFLKQWGLGACLADDMGLGKTIQTLALIQREWAFGNRAPVLLICPTSVVGNWQKEASRFTPELPIMAHHGTVRLKGEGFQKKVRKQAIVISSYALLHRDFETLQGVAWSGVVLDEAQNVKNPETKQSKAARGLKADYRIALTGTPVENNVGDLWSIMEFLNPGFLGTQAGFKKSFFIPIQAGRDQEAMERLKHLTGPFILRRLKTDKTIIADLPDKMEMKVFCTLTREQGSLYEAVVKETMEALDSTDGIQRKGVVLATLSKLKQICNHPAQFLGDNSPLPGRSGKLARLTEMMEEMMEVDDRALVFSQFAEMGEILRRHLQESFGQEVLFLHGGVPKKKRDDLVERFQADNHGPRIFILSLKAGGTGLNLTKANHVIHFDRWWNPAVENQATDRAFRIGQTKNVQVHKFLCTGTLEEKIDEMIERKKEILQGVIGTGEGWLTELSTSELKDLFALRRETLE